LNQSGYTSVAPANFSNDRPGLSEEGSGISARQLIAAVIFVGVAIILAAAVPSVEIAWVSALLILTIYLFAFEVVGVDVAAVTIMVLLGLSSLLAPMMGLQEGLVPTQHLFDGFASNAVMSIIAVMIIGAGLDKTGIMSQVATKRGGSSAVPARGISYLGALRAADVAPAHADGFLRHSGWYRNNGRVQSADSAQ
jgi:di/tricarboxylate transporter